MRMLTLFHRYFGLAFTYVCFFIFFSGTLAYYKDEITLFMQPEYYKIDYKNSDYIDTSIKYLAKNHPSSDVWRITPPSDVAPYISLSWQDDIKIKQHKRSKRALKLDPNTGEFIKARNTYGGVFLSTLHYDLWFIKKQNARQIVGYITLAMLFVLISGILIHSRIIKDFFKFKKTTLWIDLHIITSVSGFVIFLMLSISGLYLVERFMLKDIYQSVAFENKTAMQQSFDEKAKARNEERKRQRALKSLGLDKNLTIQKDIKPQNLKDKFIPTAEQIKQILQKYSNENLKSIAIQKNEFKTAYVHLNFKVNSPFSSKGLATHTEVFDILSGKKVYENYERSISSSSLVTMFMKIFHIGDFGGEWVRLIFFIFGCLGLLMCVSGVAFWSKKQHSNLARYVVRSFNNAFFIGLFTAFGVYLLTNSLISFENHIRYKLEVYAFFIAFLVIALLGVVLVKRYAYALSSVMTSIIFALVFALSALNGAFLNFATFKVALLCLLICLIFALLGFKFIKERA